MRTTALRRYPVKSLGGSPEEALDVEPWGPAGDRRWAVVDPRGARVTAREVPRMLGLRAIATDTGGVRISAPDGEITVEPPLTGPRVPVGFSRLPAARDAGEPAAELLSSALGAPVRLVWQADPAERSVNPVNGGLPGETLTLADAGPLLLTSETSLARLQEWGGEEPRLSMWRFRPNVVVDGGHPFAEDDWTSVRIGEVDLRVQHACDRCVMTCIDPDTLELGAEPLRTLARHRFRDGAVWFGVWLVPLGTGRIRVGDPVTPA